MAMTAISNVNPSTVATRMGRDLHPTAVPRSRWEVARTVRAMGIGLTDARKGGPQEVILAAKTEPAVSRDIPL